MAKSATARHVPGATCDTGGRILEAAEELFSEQGFDAVSINSIAARAGISKANVFHHFGSKDELYVAVLQRARRDAAEHLRSLAEDNLPFARRLADFAARHLTRLLENERISRLTLRELLTAGPHRAREMAEQVFGDNFKRLVLILREGQRSGDLRAELDPAMIATLLLGANVFFFEARMLLRNFPDVDFVERPDHYAGMLVDILLAGISTEPCLQNMRVSENRSSPKRHARPAARGRRVRS